MTLEFNHKIDWVKRRLANIESEIEEFSKTIINLLKKEQEKTISGDEEFDLQSAKESIEETKQEKSRCLEILQKYLETAPSRHRSFSESGRKWIHLVTGVDMSYRKWTGYNIDVNILPRTGFQTKFEEIGQVFHQFKQGSHVVFIDLFLSDILLRQEFGNSLWIYKGLEFSANGIVKGDTGIFEKLQMSGKMDYTIGFTRNDDMFAKSFPMDNHLIALEAKNKLGADDLLNCFAQAASLYKIRVDAGKANKNIWAVLSDAETWRVIYIDNDGLLWQSRDFHLDLYSYNESDVLLIYRLLYYVVKCCHESCGCPPLHII